MAASVPPGVSPALLFRATWPGVEHHRASRQSPCSLDWREVLLIGRSLRGVGSDLPGQVASVVADSSEERRSTWTWQGTLQQVYAACCSPYSSERCSSSWHRYHSATFALSVKRAHASLHVELAPMQSHSTPGSCGIFSNPNDLRHHLWPL